MPVTTKFSNHKSPGTVLSLGFGGGTVSDAVADQIWNFSTLLKAKGRHEEVKTTRNLPLSLIKERRINF